MNKQAFVDRVRNNFPDKLIELDQWVCWRVEMRDGDPTKVPYAINGLRAESDNPATWSSFEDVCSAYLAGNYAGVGFMFSEHDPYTGIDFDKCVSGEVIDPKRAEWVHGLASYSEFSQSKTGIHTIVEGRLPAGGRKSRQLNVEMYDRLRFFVVTGDHVPGSPLSLHERQNELTALHLEVFGQPKTKKAQPTQHSEPAAIPDDDQALLRLMFASKNGAQVESLWRGNTSAYGNDHSSADLALCNHLAFWTGNDPERIDRMFRMSALARDKWDRNARTGETYGDGTIARAISATTQTYSPRVHTNGHSKAEEQPPPEPEDWMPGEPVAADQKNELPPVDLDQFFLLQSADDTGNAQCVHKVHGPNFTYCDAYGWMQNVGTHWIYSGLAEKEINLAITKILIDRRMAGVRANNETVIKATKPSARNKENTRKQFKDIVWCDVGEFDHEKHLLNCKNGIVDLRSGKLITREASSRFTYCVNADYDPDASTMLWTSFLGEVVKDYSLISEWMQMACGYSITGYTSEEIMFYLFGPTRSGKGTFTNAYLNMMGHPLAIGVNFSTFTSKREGDSQNFDLAPLKPSRFIAASESGKYQSLNEAVIKQITGNDPIRASFKGKDHFTFFPQFKVWLSSNHPVKGDVDDDAFWGRVKVIDFPNSHLGIEDKSLKEKMMSAEYKAALLAWSVAGACMWHNEPHGLKTPQVIQDTTDKQRNEQDSVQGWLTECTIKGDYETVNSDLYASYSEWCRANGHTPKHSAMFGRSMGKKGFEQISIRQPAKNPARGYRGVGLLYK